MSNDFLKPRITRINTNFKSSVFVITLRQPVLSANYTNAIRMIYGLKRFVSFVIAQAILRVIEIAKNCEFSEN